MGQVGRSVDPLVGTRQRRQELACIQNFDGGSTVLELREKALELWKYAVPVVEQRLERRDDAAHASEAITGARDQGELAVPGSVAQGRELHGVLRSAGSCPIGLAARPERLEVRKARCDGLQVIELELESFELCVESSREVASHA